jgi:hypothetical protein
MYDYEIYHPNEPIKCPVCKLTLGERNPADRLWIRCEECATDHYFPSFREVPTRSCPDSLKYKGGCGCGRCGH